MFRYHSKITIDSLTLILPMHYLFIFILIFIAKFKFCMENI